MTTKANGRPYHLSDALRTPQGKPQFGQLLPIKWENTGALTMKTNGEESAGVLIYVFKCGDGGQGRRFPTTARLVSE